MKVLITGACGFLGANTIAVALREGYEVAGVDTPQKISTGRATLDSFGCPDVAIIPADLAHAVKWRALLREANPDAIVHLAGVTRRDNSRAAWSGCLQSNVATAMSFIRAVADIPEERRPVFVYPGSQMEYGVARMPWTEATKCLPVNAYGASKLMATTLVTAAARAGLLSACVVRFPVIFGPGQPPHMFVPELIVSAIRGEHFKMTKGSQRRRLVFVEDASIQMLEVASRLKDGEGLPALLNAACLEPMSVVELARSVLEIARMEISLGVGELPDRPGEMEEGWPDDSLARKLGFHTATSLKEGLSRTICWYGTNWCR